MNFHKREFYRSFSTAFLHLFYSFSTAFLQLFYSFSTAFLQLFYSFSTAFIHLRHIIHPERLSLHVHDMSLFHFVPWRRLADDGGGFRRGKSMGCTPNTILTYKLYARLSLTTDRPVKLQYNQKGEVFIGPPSPHCVGTTADIRQVITPNNRPVKLENNPKGEVFFWTSQPSLCWEYSPWIYPS